MVYIWDMFGTPLKYGGYEATAFLCITEGKKENWFFSQEQDTKISLTRSVSKWHFWEDFSLKINNERNKNL